MRIFLLSSVVAMLVLSGCRSAPTLTEIPVAVRCIDAMPESPVLELYELPSGSPFDAQVEALLVDHARLQASLTQHRALMLSCLIN